MGKWIFIIFLLVTMAGFGQVNLQTGAAEAGFPLFQYSDAKTRLNTAISLNYVAGSGLRVNDIASSVGTGWELLAGGFISRLQHGEPDDQKFINPLDYGFQDMIVMDRNIDLFYPDGYLYTDRSPQSAIPGEACYSPVFVKVSPAEYKPNFDDREQDVFVFQFNGRRGQFVINKDHTVKVLDDSKLQITFDEADMRSQFVRTKITSFTVTDEEGLKYTFAEKELTQVFKYTQSGVVNNFTILKGVSFGNNAVDKIVTRWFLTEIKNPFTNEKITFNYDTYQVDMDGPRHITQERVDSHNPTNHMTIERIKRSSKRLISISTPDTYQVNFNYSALQRVDIPGDKALTDISISYNNGLLYSYHFNYSYFVKNTIKDYGYSFQPDEIRYARLCLTDFRKIGMDGMALPPYIFTYIMPPAANEPWYVVAPMFSLYSDHWGFFNPVTTNVYEQSNGDPSGSFGEKICQFYDDDDDVWESYGIIKTVQYPEGGTLEFQFEHNQAANSPYTFQKIGGIRVARTILYDGISHGNDIIKHYQYVKDDGTTSGWGFELPKYKLTMGLRQYKLSSNDNPRGGINVKEFGSNFINTLLQVRMSQMASGTLGGSLFNAETFEAAGTQMLIALVVAQIIDFFSPDYKDYSLTIVKSDNYNLVNPLPQQYSRVEVINEGANNGKVVYEFTNPATVDPDISNAYALRDPGPFAAPYSGGKQRYAYWLYGSPTVITWLNASNQPVRKVENDYNPVVREINDPGCLSRSWYVNKNVVDVENLHGLAEFDPSFVTNETFYPIQGRLELSKTKETIYNKNGESATTETSYTYSPNNFMIQTTSRKDSKGDYTGTTTYYTADYNAPGIINTMNGNSVNMVNVPVSINNWVKSGAGTSSEKLVNATVMDYGVTSNNDIRPVQIYKSELTAPMDNTVANVQNFNSGNYKNYSYLKPHSAMVYSNGNLVQTTANYGNSSKSVIYDYSQRQAVAEVINATIDEIRYTSFEADAGPWTYDAEGIVNVYCPTGKRCFDLSKGNVECSNNISRTKPYVVSLWTTGNQVSLYLVNGTAQQISPSKSGPTINGWTYYEFELSAGSLANLRISGIGLLDEVRYYPKGAQMTTHTYSPGVGKTSDCDVNNRITRYEYDGLGRLIKVRDQYSNLIKTYEYNYKQ